VLLKGWLHTLQGEHHFHNFGDRISPFHKNAKRTLGQARCGGGFHVAAPAVDGGSAAPPMDFIQLSFAAYRFLPQQLETMVGLLLALVHSPDLAARTLLEDALREGCILPLPRCPPYHICLVDLDYGRYEHAARVQLVPRWPHSHIAGIISREGRLAVIRGRSAALAAIAARHHREGADWVRGICAAKEQLLEQHRLFRRVADSLVVTTGTETTVGAGARTAPGDVAKRQGSVEHEDVHAPAGNAKRKKRGGRGGKKRQQEAREADVIGTTKGHEHESSRRPAVAPMAGPDADTAPSMIDIVDVVRTATPAGAVTPAPAAYHEVLALLVAVDEGGEWPETSKSRRQRIHGRTGDSFTLGVMPDSMEQPKANVLFPALMHACFALERRVCPDRPASTTIVVNRHAQFKPHTDSGAGVGQTLSLIVGLGDYTGGELVVEGSVEDIRYRPLQFDGWKQRHWTLPFQGSRYSIVWFSPRGCKAM